MRRTKELKNQLEELEKAQEIEHEETEMSVDEDVEEEYDEAE